MFLVASLSITTLVSTSMAFTMWSPTTVSSLVVHGFLGCALTLPLLSVIIKIPFFINRSSRFTRLSRVHTLTAFSGILILLFLGVSQLISQSGFTETAKQTWQVGFSIPSILSSYHHLFRLLNESPLFWRFLLPFWIFQTIYDWALYIYQDFFILFKDLGLGGSGTTFKGYAIGRLRAYFANIDVLHPPRVPQLADPWRGRLDVLPQREGPRPTILGCTPQRQVDFPCPPNTTLALERLYDEFVAASTEKDRLVVRASYLEPGLLALRRALTVPTEPTRGGPLDPTTLPPNSRDVYGGEIVHVHREGTIHIILHPADCRRVIERGWGERHPFCTDAWYWSFWYNTLHKVRFPVPEHLMILYAPRHQGDYDVIKEIIRAAVWHATEGRLYPITADTYPIPPAPTA